MWKTNLKVLAATLIVVGFYTGVAHIIPQLQSEVPEAPALTGDVSPAQLAKAGERIYNGAGGAPAAPPAAAPATGAGPAMTATTDPMALFTEKGCVGCHVLNGQGGQVGPPLEHIGRTRSAEYIRRALLT